MRVSQRRKVPSRPTDAITRPSGLKESAVTASVWPSRHNSSERVWSDHTRTVMSSEPVASSWPPGANDIAVTGPS
jgi:hypothetical protein